MKHYDRTYITVTFKSLVEGLYFAQVHNVSRTRVVHETGLYSSRVWAKHVGDEWAETSNSKLAQSLEPQGEPN